MPSLRCKKKKKKMNGDYDPPVVLQLILAPHSSAMGLLRRASRPTIIFFFYFHPLPFRSSPLTPASETCLVALPHLTILCAISARHLLTPFLKEAPRHTPPPPPPTIASDGSDSIFLFSDHSLPPSIITAYLHSLSHIIRHLPRRHSHRQHC